MADWQNFGDINVLYGTLFILDEGDDDFVRAVEVIPCSDAGGPDNLFVIEEGSIYLPTDVAKRNMALPVIGCRLLDNGMMYDNGDTVAPDTQRFRHNMIQAFRAYHGLETDVEHVVQIGKHVEESSGWSPEPTDIIHGNSSLRRWVEDNCL